jgi:putative hydrolase of the HAD superfamily
LIESSKVIVFDVDGVLIRNFNEKKQFLWSLTIEQDLGVTDNVMRDIFSVGWHDCIKGKSDTHDHVQSILTRHKLPLEARAFIRYWHERDSAFDSGVMDCVVALPHRRKFLATNQDKPRTAFLKNKIGHLFEGVFSSSEIGSMKPEDGFFRHVEAALGVVPENIVFIDDLPVNIAAAHARGWTTHHYQDVNGLRNVLGLAA